MEDLRYLYCKILYWYKDHHQYLNEKPTYVPKDIDKYNDLVIDYYFSLNPSVAGHIYFSPAANDSGYRWHLMYFVPGDGYIHEEYIDYPDSATTFEDFEAMMTLMSNKL